MSEIYTMAEEYGMTLSEMLNALNSSEYFDGYDEYDIYDCE